MASCLLRPSDFSVFLDKATESSLLEPDGDAVQSMCQMVDEHIIEPEDAINAINNKILDENPKTIVFALQILRAIVLAGGNLVHRVIITDDYMDFLKGILDSSEQNVKEEILKLVEDWVKLFHIFPKYNAPRKFLEKLQGEGYVFQNIPKPKQNTIVPFDTMFQKIKTEKIQDANDSFKKDMEEIKERQRQKHRAFRKANGLPTSSDEEDVEMKSDGSQKKDGEILKKTTLSKDLDLIKNQRLRLDAAAKDVRMERHQNFMEKNHSCELRQCQRKNCTDCEKYKRKPQPENVPIPKQLPKELKKIKDSRAIIKDSWQELKESKRQTYYRNSPRSLEQHSLSNNGVQSGRKLGGVPPSETEVLFHSNAASRTRAMDEEDEDLRRALEISVYDRGNGASSNPYEDDDDEPDDMQQAINASFLEEQNKNFSSPSKVLLGSEEDLQLLYAKQMSLEEAGGVQDDSENASDEKDRCAVCHDKKNLKRFVPCLHRCICENCSLTFISRLCPICKTPYFQIS